MEKSDKTGRRFELLPPLIRLLLWFPMSFGADVWVGMMGSKLDAKTIEATGFHRAMLVSSWFSRITMRYIVLGVVEPDGYLFDLIEISINDIESEVQTTAARYVSTR